MVLVGISDLDEETAGKYPGIYQYGQCQSRAFMKGIFAFFAGGAIGLTASYTLRQRYPNFPPLYNVVFVAGGAIITSYVVASIASKQCQRLWVRAAQQPTNPTGMTTAAASNQKPADGTPIQTAPGLAVATTKYGDRMG